MHIKEEEAKKIVSVSWIYLKIIIYCICFFKELLRNLWIKINWHVKILCVCIYRHWLWLSVIGKSYYYIGVIDYYILCVMWFCWYFVTCKEHGRMSHSPQGTSTAQWWTNATDFKTVWVEDEGRNRALKVTCFAPEIQTCINLFWKTNDIWIIVINCTYFRHIFLDLLLKPGYIWKY